MRLRRDSRDKNPPKQYDKKKNTLIAIPGSPGSGKSTFLAHFPESVAFKCYLDHHPLIVSTLTFNSAMNGGRDSIGLRIIFGAAISMGLFNSSYTWLEFYTPHMNCFPENYNLEALQAVDLLQRVFGQDHRVLIMVDELKKADNSSHVMSQLGVLLDKKGECDMLVSALSPEYIRKLLSGSQRPVSYVILEPLLDSRLGKDECLVWANRLIDEVGADKVDLYKQRLLRNTYLLFSGHPRALEFLCECLKEGRYDWSGVKDSLNEMGGTSLAELLYLLIKLPYNFDAPVGCLTESTVENYVFRTPCTAVTEDINFRELVEEGTVMIYKKGVGNEFTIGLQSRYILELAASESKSSMPITRAANLLLGNLRSCSGAGTIWERMVAFTVVSRSYSLLKLSDVLGIQKFNFPGISWKKFCMNVVIPPISIKSQGLHLLLEEEDKAGGSPGSSLLFPSRPTAGFDAIVRALDDLEESWVTVYLQIKVLAPTDTFPTVLGKLVANNLKDFLLAMRLKGDSLPDLESLHMIVYHWGGNVSVEQAFDRSVLDGDCVDRKTMRKKVLNVARKIIQQSEGVKSNKTTIQDDYLDSIVRDFLSNHWYNIHIVSERQLRGWLNPSVLAFPLLFDEIREEEKE